MLWLLYATGKNTLELGTDICGKPKYILWEIDSKSILSFDTYAFNLQLRIDKSKVWNKSDTVQITLWEFWELTVSNVGIQSSS